MAKTQRNVRVDLQIASKLDNPPDEIQFLAWLSATLAAAGEIDDVGYELAVRVVDEDESQALNKQYRQKDKPTNVLSFPFYEMPGMPDDEVRPLGDLVICGSVVLQEAAEQGKEIAHHWAHMLVHGTLHLLGFDHETVEQAAPMEALERRILKEFGIGDPYKESGPGN